MTSFRLSNGQELESGHLDASRRSAARQNKDPVSKISQTWRRHDARDLASSQFSRPGSLDCLNGSNFCASDPIFKNDAGVTHESRRQEKRNGPRARKPQKCNHGRTTSCSGNSAKYDVKPGPQLLQTDDTVSSPSFQSSAVSLDHRLIHIVSTIGPQTST